MFLSLPTSVPCSELRQVPDNQEVFVHPSTDQSFILELLEYQENVLDENAARYVGGGGGGWRGERGKVALFCYRCNSGLPGKHMV